MNFNDFFFRATTWPAPTDWQTSLVNEPIGSRFIRIPTGFGKTAGAAIAWIWNRIQCDDDSWPRRLVWCLPMRVLVEQTEAEVRAMLQRLDLLWDGASDHTGKVGVHLLMGGAEADAWHLYPESCAVLIGTQDMLLSRALNRGYGAARGRWPIDFGLTNQDCLWVMDEVQLMDVGLATSGQLQAFREECNVEGKSLRPCHTWWMSATLQRSWLEVSPDSQPVASKLPLTQIPSEGRKGRLWEDVSKPVCLEKAATAKAIAQFAAKAHLEEGRGARGPTLIVINRVDDAVAVHAELEKEKALIGTDLRLVHSRFRPFERVAWRNEFLNRSACGPNTDRIIVSTQVVEAGVDISAAVLVTQLAPWASLVQRFGRAARWGGLARIVVTDHEPKDDKAAAPYMSDEIDAARKALIQLEYVAPLQLEAFEEAHLELLSELYPYSPKNLLLRHEVDDLFDTTPDLTGADVDISRFIRSGDERDVQVFWHETTLPDSKLRPSREALCAVPFLKAREWLCGLETSSSKAPRLKRDMQAWVWDWLEGSWKRAERRDLYPGQIVLVAAKCGGYDEKTGWNPDSKTLVTTIPEPTLMPAEQSDAAQDNEQLSVTQKWQTIATHGRAVAGEAVAIVEKLNLAFQDLFDLAGRWHDVGKAHEAFQNSSVGQRPERRDLAKAPSDAWLPAYQLYIDENGRRRGSFRHEIASSLGLFAVLTHYQPDHPALLGPWRALFAATGMSCVDQRRSDSSPNSLEKEILALSETDFDLLVYLVCSHHGKIRLCWHSSPADQLAADGVLRIRGIRDGETLPAVTLADANGCLVQIPACTLLLAPSSIGLNPVTGRGWTERVLGLLQSYGPFCLAYLEALLRAADQRASQLKFADPMLAGREVSA